MNSDNSIVIPLSKTGKYRGMYEAIVDYEDRDLGEYNWTVAHNTANLLYVKRHINNGKTHKVYLHRVILERMLDRPLVKGEVVDHVNQNPLDNRRSNLRLATTKQNNANMRIRNDNQGGYKGICWAKHAKKWQSKITINGRTKHLGYFFDKIEAHRAYCKKAFEIHGEFANFGENSPFTREDFE